MFGQSMATFIPPLLSGTVVFMRGFNPHDIVRQIESRRMSVLVSVPKILDVLREHTLRVAPESAEPPPGKEHFTKRWWRYRRAHRLFGMKFWSFVVGAAPLDPSLEEFWGRLGFVVIQGYGLTETAPIVSLNHPFSASKGSVGKAISGVEVKIAADGEILVRGDNVTTGYFGAAEATAQAFEGGWFHTGDIGDVDAEGRMFIRGRKKEMIVTPEGLNVFPEDVERVVAALPGVGEVAVVGVRSGSDERVHAVVVIEPGVDPQSLVRQANQALLDHQKIRGISAWPGQELPRTEGTRKLKRQQVREWVASGSTAPTAGAHGSGVEACSRSLPTAAPWPAHDARRAGPELARTRGADGGAGGAVRPDDRRKRVRQRPPTSRPSSSWCAPSRRPGRSDETRWPPSRWTSRRGTARGGRAPRGASATRRGCCRWPRLFAWVKVEGLEHLDRLEGPVIFAANHQSHMDTPAILWALPGRWRYRVAVAMAKEFFKAHFFPEQFPRSERLTNSLNYYLSSLLLQRLPAPATRGWRPPDAALHRRPGHRRLVGAHLP